MSRVIDDSSGISFSYGNLFDSINNCTPISTIIQFSNYSDFFREFFSAIINNYNITLLDKEFTDEEIKLLSINISELETNTKIDNPINVTENNFSELVLNSKSNITLFTSGTTGIPKAVTHSVSNLVRGVKTGKKFKNNVWGFCYNPTHIAGLQVLFQAVSNLNSIVILFNNSRGFITEQINKYSITHISATPTFYRLLKPFTENFATVTSITSGGEKLDKSLADELKINFPNSKIHNIYAMTEAGTILSSDGNVFSIKDELKDLVKIENNELIIHNSFLGNELKNNDWYRTGDIIEYIDNSKSSFIFVCRNNEMINIGGIKINPGEIENELLKFSGIKNAIVYGKANSVIGTVLVADIVLEENIICTEDELKNFLRVTFQENKIPRKFYFVESISQSRTGKMKRL